MDFLDNLRKLKTDTANLSSYSLDELKFLLLYARNVEQEYNNLQSVVKVDGNSLYGSCGNEFFDLGDVDIAEDITTICRHFAILVDIGINTFFTTWANEENLKTIQSFYPQVTELKNFNYRKDTVDYLCVYGDTDSRYIDLELVYNLLIVNGVSMKLPSSTKEGNNELSSFAIFLNDNFLQKIIKDTIDVDIKYRNAKPGYLKMGHETVTRKCVLVSKNAILNQ
jgi:DNA polymerase elongation subunit (family B)